MFLGYLPTVIAPIVFGKLFVLNNPGIEDATLATRWDLPFPIFGAGAFVAPLSMLWIAKLPQAKLINSTYREEDPRRQATEKISSGGR